MGIFATRTRKGAQAEVVRDARATPDVQGQMPPARFEVVGEHLAAGRDASVVCALVGREMARDGADLGEALDGLRITYARVLNQEPPFGAVRALGAAWSEETLGFLHQLSCENPLTGLASLPHLRARISETYRVADHRETPASTSHALVVIDLPLVDRPAMWQDAFESTLRLVRVAEHARIAFPAGETICQLSARRLVVLAERADLLAERVAVLRDLVEDLSTETSPRASTSGMLTGATDGRARVWVEGLPPADAGAGALLDELACS